MCYIQRAFSLPAASGLAWWRQTVSLFMDPILIRFFYYKIALNGFSKFSMTQLLVCWAPSYVREWAHMLGPKSVTFKKTGRREEREEKTHLPRFYQQINAASSVVRLSWNLEKRFETQVATIWTIRSDFELGNWCYCPWTVTTLFGILSSIFIYLFCQERLYNSRLYVLLMYLTASRDYSRETCVTHYCW